MNELASKQGYTNSSVKANFFPSKSPLSLNFSSGITNKAIKLRVIKGALRSEPSSLAALLIVS